MRINLLNIIFSCTFIFLLVNSSTHAQTQLQWGVGMGGSGWDEGRSVTTDIAGNVYTIGTFLDTVDFDPSAGTCILASAGGKDIFVTKIDAQGNFIWAKSIGDTTDEEGTDIAVDAVGNVHITGYFDGTVDFDPSANVFNLTATGIHDAFICKLNGAGNLVWAKRMGGAYYDAVYSIAIDALGNVYTTGIFVDTCDFDPSANVFNLVGSPVNVNVFISKLDVEGNFVWAKGLIGAWSDSYSIALDNASNVYLAGEFGGTVDFDPGIDTFNLSNTGIEELFICKLDSGGDFVWAKNMGNLTPTPGGYQAFSLSGIATDGVGGIYITGILLGSADFDPSPAVANLASNDGYGAYVGKYDNLGNFEWVRGISANSSWTGNAMGCSIAVDGANNVYITGYFGGAIGFDPSYTPVIATSTTTQEIFIAKFTTSGNAVWLKNAVGNFANCGMFTSCTNRANTITTDALGNIYITGAFNGTTDFSFATIPYYLSAPIGEDVFILKIAQKGVSGTVFQDNNQNCQEDNNDFALGTRLVTIQPGNFVAQTNNAGIWYIDSLPLGNYTVTIDTTSTNWLYPCAVVQNFTVTNPDSCTTAPAFGLLAASPCPSPNISINAPFLRPGFSNQYVYVSACNLPDATGILYNGYVIVELDSLLMVQSSSLSYVALGNNQYRVSVGFVYPGQCVNFWLACQVSANAALGQTLCVEAELFPVVACALDTIPTIRTLVPCTTVWDNSNLQIEGTCVNDSLRFVIHNTAAAPNGNMTCFAPVRLFIDGQYTSLDSIQLAGGDSSVFQWAADGHTWRLEVEQHPLHPGNSHPNATVERCGDLANWTPNLVNMLPQDDADLAVDIYCGEVRGSYDPNDKMGFPLGLDSTHTILQNQEIEYVIRFQNTGTDTAFTIVVRDTLSPDLDIFSVRSGVSNHTYNFRMYGQRVLEWRFNNIMLPDSGTNEPESHGFIKFTVKQNPNLAISTLVENKADIYFDFNAPVTTNTYFHTIGSSSILNAIKVLTPSESDICIYPNPTPNHFIVDFGQSISQARIQIYSLDGKLLRSQTSIATKIQEFNLEQYPTGLYLVMVQIDSKPPKTFKISKI